MKLIASILIVMLSVAASRAAADVDKDAGLALRSPTASSTLCSAINVCPDCHLKQIKDGFGSIYTVHCNTLIISPQTYLLEGKATRRDCLEACGEFEGCWGVSIWNDAKCELAVEADSHTVLHAGVTAFVRNTITGSALTYSSIKTSASTTSHSSAASCTATAISCPHCDNQIVTDLAGKAYHVYCENQLFADGNYNLQEWTSPQGCLAACDNFTWCYGSTFWPQGNCQLAKGPGNVFPQEMPGYTAFLPVATITRAQPTVPSAFPSDSGYQPGVTETNSAFLSLRSPTPSPSATSQAPCTLPNVTCPDCDGRVITDESNQKYRVHCNVQPRCDTFMGTYTSQATCLEHCDTDPTCLAVWWDSFAGTCSLCEDGLLGYLPTGQEPHAFVVFVAEAAANSSVTGTSGIAISTHGGLSSISVVTAAYSKATGLR